MRSIPGTRAARSPRTFPSSRSPIRRSHDGRWLRLRDRRQHGRVHDPVDLQGVRVCPGAGDGRCRAGRIDRGRRAERRRLQLHPAGFGQSAVQSHGQCRRDRLHRPDLRTRAGWRLRLAAAGTEPLCRTAAGGRRAYLPLRARIRRPETGPSPICCATTASSRATSTRFSTSISASAHCASRHGTCP